MIEIYTDGSGTTATKPCGWAFVIVQDGVAIHEQCGSLPKGTNNVAELTAAIKGLAYAIVQGYHTKHEITLVSDSQLVLGYADGSYKIKALHLASLYVKLKKLYTYSKATGRWVKGHTGNTNNERCDKLAKSARLKML